jgi:hypothetical protein
MQQAVLVANGRVKGEQPRASKIAGIIVNTRLRPPVELSIMAIDIDGDGRMSLSLAEQFEANLPGLSKPIRITTRHDAAVFTYRWTIRDRDPALKTLLREIQRANSSVVATSAILKLKQALASRGLLNGVDNSPNTPAVA